MPFPHMVEIFQEFPTARERLSYSSMVTKEVGEIMHKTRKVDETI